ncbi:hypothetical protein [Streptomyces sp. XH2]|uniref:hypothetical protein n=1 Tax=Streptomyces sp. XH2 TaxID=3412483 RepID=UPI003C7CAE0C
MSDSKYVVVAELGLAKNKYGADIRTSEPMTLDEARAYVRTTLRGDNPDFFCLPKEARTLQLDGTDQYLVIEGHRLAPDSLSRFTIAREI